MKIITEKPNNITQDNLDVNLRISAVPLNISEKIKEYFKVPNEKYPNPLTSSQELGWLQDNKLNKNQRRHPRLGCDVTKYADEYCFSTGVSPFSSKDIKKNESKK